jgi:HEAT repeat protein
MTDIAALVDKFRGGDEENALHGLIELPNDALPELIEYFRAETLAPVRALLVKAVWERRDPAVVPFLAEALQDLDEEVWQEALDGLVTLASPEALEVLQSAKDSRSTDAESDKRFRLWLGEAIQQVQFELRR